jgi:hypothetical protein
MKMRWFLAAAAVWIAASIACGTQGSAAAINPPTLTPPSGGATEAAAGQGTQPSEAITITKVTMFRDDGNGKPGDQVSAFKPSDRVMHFEAEARGVKPGQTVKLVFSAIDTTAGKDIKIAEADTGQVFIANQITGQVSLTEDWPVGSYKMDIYVDGTLVYTWNYSVE